MRISPFGPIFAKELRATARRKRTYWLRTLYLAALFLFMLLAYTSTSSRGSAFGSVAARAREEAELGFAFFTTFAIFSVLAMPLIGPILTATAISGERLGRTLHVLLMTPITSWQIVSGKLFSRLLIALMLLGLSLPVLAVVRLLGGVDLDAMFASAMLCASAALFAAALGLFYSCLMNRAYAVILMSYLTLFLLYAMIPFVLELSVQASRPRMGRPVGVDAVDATLSITNPVVQTVQLISRGRAMWGGLSWGWCVAFHIAMAGGLILATGALLRRQVKREGESAGGAAAATPPELPAWPESTPPPAATDAERPVPARRDQREVGDNPVLWRELRRPLMNKPWQRRVGAACCVALLLLTYVLLANQYTNELAKAETHVGYACIFCFLLTLLACVLAGTAISSEKESDTWALLLTTPLDGYAIVRGKALGVFRRTMWPTILIVTHLLVFALFGVISWTSAALAVWAMLAFNSVWVATGLYYSLKLKNNTFAVIANLLTPLCIYGAVPVVMLILGNVLLDSRSERALEWTFYYMPYMYIGMGIDGLSPKENWVFDRLSTSLSLPYHEHGATPREFIMVALAVGAAHLIVALLLLWRIGYRFDRIVGRAPQSAPMPAGPVIGRSAAVRA